MPLEKGRSQMGLPLFYQYRLCSLVLHQHQFLLIQGGSEIRVRSWLFSVLVRRLQVAFKSARRQVVKKRKARAKGTGLNASHRPLAHLYSGASSF
jgi:hypothetical protein